MSLTVADYIEINERRAQLEAAMEAECDHLVSTQTRVRRECGSPLLNSKGFGHRTIGAKQHGKVAMPVRGSGYGRYDAERLWRRQTAAV